MNSELQIILLIRSYNRPEYLEKTLSSVLSSDIDICVKRYIFDDCSDDNNVIQLLSNKDYIYVKGKEFIPLRRKKNLGCKESYIEALNYIKKIYSESNFLICTIDNDVIVKPDFISVIKEEYYKAYEKYKTFDILLTGFNPTNAHVNMIEDNGSYYRKTSIGGVNFIFHIKFIDFIIDNWSIGDSDWGVVNKMNDCDMPICCLKKSVVNHIGCIGLNSGETYDNDEFF